MTRGAEMVDQFRIPPHSIEAEQSILGGLFLDPHAFDKIPFLSEQDFYSHQHRGIFAALRDMREADHQIDPLLVCEELERRGNLGEVGGNAYIGSLVVNTLSAANIRRYAEIVRDKSILRTVMKHSVELHAKAAEPGINPRELADEAEMRFMSVLDSQMRQGDAVTFGEAVGEANDMLEKQEPGTQTGFADLDRVLSGGHRLHAVDARQSGEPDAGNQRDQPRAKGHRQGVQRAGGRGCAIVARTGKQN